VSGARTSRKWHGFQEAAGQTVEGFQVISLSLKETI
jgi:hypothetical protein